MARRAVKRNDAATTATRAARRDGWENVYTGLGTASRDKRRGAQVSVLTLNWQACESLYRGDDMFAKIVDEPPREGTRKWLDVQVQEDKEAGEELEHHLRALKAKAKLREAWQKSRAYGGAGVVLGIDDGTSDPALPVREGAIKAIRFLNVFDSSELRPASYYEDPSADKFGEVETYRIHPQGLTARTSTLVHETRVLRFEGPRVSRRVDALTQGWGDSVAVRILEVLSDFGMAWGGAGHLVQDFSQAIFAIRGLTELLSEGKEDVVRKRLEAIEMGRSMVRAVLIDAGDEGSTGGETYERKVTPLTGLPDMLTQMNLRLSAAADMPLSRLFGQANGGLGSDDKAGATWWTERIEGLQEEVLLEPVTRLVRLLMLAKGGPTKGAEPKNWSIVFRPLRQLDPVQEADRRLKLAQADAAYVQVGVLSQEEVAVSRFGGDAYGQEITIDLELRRKMEETPDPEDPEDDEPGGGKPPGKPAAP